MSLRNQTLLSAVSRKLTRLVAASVITLSVSINACSDSSTEPVLTDDERIQETTLRFMTELSWDSYYAFVTFYIVDGAAPLDHTKNQIYPLPVHQFRRLDDIAHPIRPYEECTGMVRHPDFVKPGIGIWVGKVTHIGTNKVVVYSGYYLGLLASAGYLVRIEKRNGVWGVVDFDIVWIS